MNLHLLGRRIVECSQCPRLVEWRQSVALAKRRAYADSEYWGKPVPGFGDENASVLVVGLAPGAHGSNRTGRQFTGDASGRFLFPALWRAGLASQPDATSREDGLELRDVFITAACRCVPPRNRPLPQELANCRPYLEREIDLLAPRVIVCLGHLAFASVLKIHSLRASEFRFAHGAQFRIPLETPEAHRWLLCSYHPSQQNTRTGRLTNAMFDQIWRTAGDLVKRV
jgi:uracil-DNA glycosylase family 4